MSASGISIAPGDACAAVSPEQVRCPISGTPEGVLVAGSSGSDRIEIGPTVPGSAGALVEGDLGADFIVGSGGDDSLDGGGSEGSLLLDVLRGGAGDDALTSAAGLEGGTGSDLLIATPCAGQTVDGGAGADSVSFARVEANVEAEIGGIAGFAPVKDGPLPSAADARTPKALLRPGSRPRSRASRGVPMTTSYGATGAAIPSSDAAGTTGCRDRGETISSSGAPAEMHFSDRWVRIDCTRATAVATSSSAAARMAGATSQGWIRQTHGQASVVCWVQSNWSRNWSPTPANSVELLGRDWLYQARFASSDTFRLNF